jgi:hypothetical protein
LHIAAFVTLCEAYLGIDPDLDLWKYFFCVYYLHDPKAELIISGGVVIHVKSGHGADPYFEIPMPRSMKGWWKKWFYLKNDDSAPLPAFTGGHPIPLNSWGEGATGKDLNKIQPLCEHLQWLWQVGLIGIPILRMFFSRRIQPLRMWRAKTWVYPRSSYLDRPSPEELSVVEVETRICKVLDSTVIASHDASPDPIRRWIASVRVSTLVPIFVAFVILSFHNIHDFT